MVLQTIVADLGLYFCVCCNILHNCILFKEQMMKTVGLGLSAGIFGLGMTGVLGKMMPSKTTKLTLMEKIEQGKLDSPQKFPFLDAGSELALISDFFLDYICERLMQFAQFDQEIYEAFVEEAAKCAEFLLRKKEVVHKRAVPLLFRGYTQTMLIRLRELRRAIRDSQPSQLEDFDDIVAELKSFQSDQHHNLWGDSQS